MKKILGLDLGTNSIGWALVTETEDKKEILGMGSRIIPMSQDILGEFEKGNSVSQTATRTGYRSSRRLRERNLLRRERLHRVLKVLDFLPEHFSQYIDGYGNFIDNVEIKLPYSHFDEDTKKWNFIFKKSYTEMLEDFKVHQPALVAEGKKVPYDWTIYFLRKKSLTEKIEKEELAWLLLHFNQKRGYFQLRGEDEEKKEDGFQILSQKVISVIKGEKDKKYNKHWYEVTLEDGRIYKAQFYSSVEHWVGQVREFISQPKTSKDGTIKPNLSFLPTFDEIDAMDATRKAKFYTKIKIKTENEIKLSNKTVGQYIYDSLLQVPDQKIKGKLVRTIERNFYKEELEQILERQIKEHIELQDKQLYRQCIDALYPLNEEYKNSISNKNENEMFKYLFIDDILYYQRPLKSKKSEISNCTLEFRKYKDNEGKEQTQFLKCISRSHPLFQEFRIWQWMKNLRIYEREKLVIGKLQRDIDITSEFIQSAEDSVRLFDFLNTRKEIDQISLIKNLLEPKKLKGKALTAMAEKYRWNFVDDEKKTYPCNETRSQIQTRLAKVTNVPVDFLTPEREIGLWHILYSVRDKEEIKSALGKYAEKHGLDKNSFVENFKKYPLIKSEYGSYSEKAIKKLLPLMRMGKYWDEATIISNMELYQKNIQIVIDKINARVNQSSNVKEQILNLDADIPSFKGLQKDIASYLVYAKHSELGEIQQWKTPADLEIYIKEFKQHSLRNPIVEQVLTETLRIVNDIWKHPKYGNGADNFFTEIHIELGREMKNNAEDRKLITESNNRNENTNLRIRAMLAEFAKPEFDIEGVRPYSPYQQDALKIFEDGVLGKYSEDELKNEKLEDINITAYDVSRKSNPTSIEILKYKLWLEQKYRSPYTGEMIPLSKLFTPAYEIEHIIPQSVYFDDSFSNKVICESVVNKNPYKDNQFGYEFISSNEGRIVPELSTPNHTVKIFTKIEYEEFIKTHYSKNKGKAKKLLLEEVPEKMIERHLNDTRYISKIVKNLLSNVVREDINDDGVTSKNVVSCNGMITSVLKQDWGLHDVWNDLMLPRFERLNRLTKSQDFTVYNKKYQKYLPTVPDVHRKGFQLKRIDHRHHAMDALVIALATRNHINYLNNQTALSRTKSKETKLSDRYDLRKILCYRTQPDEQGNYTWQFKKPWDNITQDARKAIEKTVVSCKQNLRIINKSVNYYQSFKDEKGNIQYDKSGKPMKEITRQVKGDNWAIRKSLHKDTIAGLVKLQFNKSVLVASRTSLGPIFSSSYIQSITDTGIQKILISHLKKYDEIKDGKTIEHPELAFSPEGIEEMNKNILTLNNGKPHKPFFKVRTYEPKGNKFAVGQSGNKKAKFVEAAKGTNLFFAIYQGKNKNNVIIRVYETMPFNLVIERMKQGEKPAPAKCFDKDKCEYNLLFTLSPNDLVYVPALVERDNPTSVDFKNLNAEQFKRIFTVNDFSGNTIYFSPNSHAKNISPKEVDLGWDEEKNKPTGSFDNKTASFENSLIKETCWKIKVDRLGNISI